MTLILNFCDFDWKEPFEANSWNELELGKSPGPGKKKKKKSSKGIKKSKKR
jgi:hypothetical protein